MELELTSPADTPVSIRRMRFSGKGAELGALWLRSIVLSILTLGVYRFWGRVAMRRYLWRHYWVGEDCLAYTGTALELLLGSGKLILVFMVYLGVSLATSHLSVNLGQIISAGLVTGLIPVVTYSTRRYRFARTRLRNVAFAMGPGLAGFVRLSLMGTLASVISLGILSPLYSNYAYAYLLERTSWGTLRWRYTGDAWHVWRIWARNSPWILLSLGIYLPWVTAEAHRYRAQHSRLDGVHLQVDYSGRELAELYAGNLLLLLLTLGLALPWVVCRQAAFHAKHLQAVGNLDLASVQRAQVTGSALLDSMDDALGGGLEL